MEYEIEELNIIKRLKTALRHSHYNSMDKLIRISDDDSVFVEEMKTVRGISPESAKEVLKAIKEWRADPTNTYSSDIMKRIRGAMGLDEIDKSYDSEIILMSKDEVMDRILDEGISDWYTIKPIVEEVYQIKL